MDTICLFFSAPNNWILPSVKVHIVMLSLKCAVFYKGEAEIYATLFRHDILSIPRYFIISRNTVLVIKHSVQTDNEILITASLFCKNYEDISSPA
jgi:hypothetical protein